MPLATPIESAAAVPRVIDWVLFLALLLIVSAGLVTMRSFAPSSPAAELCRTHEAPVVPVSPPAFSPDCEAKGPGGGDALFSKQLVWIAFALLCFFGASCFEWRFLRRSSVLFALFCAGALLLLLLFGAGETVRGATSWFQLGLVNVQPVEPVKLILILVLAKYFSRRHTEIAHLRHLLIPAMYAFALFALVLLQPDFGGALVIFLLWLGMVLLSGNSKKHLAVIFSLSLLAALFLWTHVFE